MPHTPPMANFTIIQFSEREFGLYVRGYRNEYGTPLYMRGTLKEVLAARRSL